MDVLINHCVILSPSSSLFFVLNSPIFPLPPFLLSLFLLLHLQPPPTAPWRAWRTVKEACARAEPWKSSWKSAKVNARSPHVFADKKKAAPRQRRLNLAVTFSFIAPCVTHASVRESLWQDSALRRAAARNWLLKSLMSPTDDSLPFLLTCGNVTSWQ